MYYVIGGPYVSDQAGLNRGPLILIVFHCYFVSTFCEDRINTFLILILIHSRRVRGSDVNALKTVLVTEHCVTAMFRSDTRAVTIVLTGSDAVAACPQHTPCFAQTRDDYLASKQ